MSHPRDSTDPARRRFLQDAAVFGAGIALAQSAAGAAPVGSAAADAVPSDAGPDQIPRRPLGRTGLQVSAIGLGGYSLGDAPSLDEAVRIVHEAIDAGVNFFDNAWEYHDGKSEEWMGQALQGRRDKVVL